MRAAPYLRALAALAAAALGLAGCRGDRPGLPDGGPTTDAPPGVGCTARSPRAVEPEVFVGPTGLQARMTQLIDGATTSLDVQMYLFTVSALADRIIAAHARGVAVRVLLDPEHQGNTGTRARLANGGVPLRGAPTIYSFAHAKYLIVDGEAAVIMSMNFNIDAMSSERNYGLVSRDAKDVADVQAIFDMDWAAGGGEPAQPADLACTRLVVSPDNSKQRLLELIGGATSTLDVEAMYVSEVTIRNAIGAAKTRGVDVRVILEDTEDNATTIGYFESVGIPVRDPGALFVHAKLLIADGVAFVGSANFSQTALTRNREVGALVFEPAPAAAIQAQFDADWAASN